MVTSRFSNATRLFVLAVSTSALLYAAPATAAGPLTMFLLGFAKNLIDSAIEEQQSVRRVEPSVPVPQVKAAVRMDDADLRVLVDNSFAHLSSAQRAELLAGLDKALSDPANSSQREAILIQFVEVARQVQFTHGQLNRLSSDQKRAIAERFAVSYKTLTPEQQQSLLEQLRHRALPLPTDLNDMMLAALDGGR